MRKLMLVNNVWKSRRPIILGLLIPLSLLLIDAPAFAGGEETTILLRNIDWKIEGDIVIIIYDLDAPTDQEYDVQAVLHDEGNPSFAFVPEAVTGDVGKGKFVGIGKQIRWKYRKDFPSGLQGERYYFEIIVERAGGGMSWLLLGLGAAAAGGGAALLLFGKKEAGTPPQQSLPLPPGRP